MNQGRTQEFSKGLGYLVASDRLQGYHPNIAELLLTILYEGRMQDISQGGVVGLSKKKQLYKARFSDGCHHHKGICSGFSLMKRGSH